MTTRWPFRIVLPLVALFAGGALFASWLVERTDRELRADLIQQAQLLAQAMNIDQVAGLSGAAADADKPIYQRLKDQLITVRPAYPRCRTIHVAGRKADGSIVFLVDSEPAESRHASPAGQNYQEASERFRRVFDNKTAIAEGPLPGRRGDWVSVLAPIIDAQTGTLVAVLGMDIDFGDWNWMLIRSALPAALLTLALAAIMIAGVVLLDRRSRLAGLPAAWMRDLETGFMVAVGLTLSLAAAWLAYTNASRGRNESFARLAGGETGAMVEKLQSIRDNQLESLAHFYAARERISTGELEEFAQSLTKNLTVTTWGWIPVVPAADRDRFEAAARADGSDFAIWQFDARGQRVRATDRDVYYPVFQVAPPTQAERVVGGDVGSEPLRRAALETAVRTGLATGTNPVTLASGTGDQKGIVIFRPIFARDQPKHLRGFVGASVRMGSLLRTSAFLERRPLMELSLLHKGTAPETLATTWSGARPPAIGRPATRPVFAFGKVLVVTTHPGREFARDSPLRAGGLALVLGLALTGAVGTITRLTLRQRTRLKRLVEERTFELRQSEESYRNQFANNSAVMLLINPVDAAIVDANAAAANFYGYTQDRLLLMRISDINIRPAGEVMEIVQEVAKGQRNRFEAQHRLASGEVRHVAVASSAIQYRGRTTLHAIIQDITEQKQAQEALRESAQRYRSIISVSNTGAWEYHSDTAYLWCSPEYFGMLGRSYTDFDLSGRRNLQETWVDLLHPEDRESASAHFAEYLKNGSIGTYESYFRMRHRSGNWVWIWSRGQTLRDANGKVTNLTVGTHIDITERKKAAEDLELAHGNLQVRVKELRCLYAISKLTAESDRSIGEVLAAAVELIPAGWRYSEIARARITYQGQVFATAGFQITPWIQWADIMIAGKAVGTVEVCYLEERSARTVAPFVIEEQTLLANIASQFGVTIERRQAEGKLRQLSSIIEQAPLSVIITNLERVIEYVNPKFSAVTGYSKEEVIGQHAAVLGTRGMQPEVYDEAARAVSASEVWMGELRSRKKNGEVFLENVVVAPLIDENGRPTHYVVLKDDITAQKRSEAELTKVRELSDLKSQFISVASHEFRTPLAAAVGSLELLERHAGRMTEAKRGELLGRAQRSLGRLTEIMNNVLQLSRADSGRVKVKRMAVDLVQFVQDIIRDVEAGDRQQHTFSFQHSGDGTAVPVDTNLLNHILSNLLGNAVRYSPVGTRISITLDIDEQAFVLTIADEGIGIPAAERERVFEPFARGSNVGQIGGTGLGLNIVKRYTELMGGRIELLPVDRGATFRVRIPCTNGNSQS